MATQIKPGSIWQHYKGDFYRVITVARLEADPETEVVVYQALSPSFEIWVRPVEDWYKRVAIKPGTIGKARFEPMGYRLIDVTRD